MLSYSVVADQSNEVLLSWIDNYYYCEKYSPKSAISKLRNTIKEYNYIAPPHLIINKTEENDFVKRNAIRFMQNSRS